MSRLTISRRQKLLEALLAPGLSDPPAMYQTRRLVPDLFVDRQAKDPIPKGRFVYSIHREENRVWVTFEEPKPPPAMRWSGWGWEDE